MSQYPGPYPGPPQQQPLGYSQGYAPPPAADPLAPARFASLAMFVLGGLGMICGMCLGAFATMPLEQIMAQQGASLPALPPGVSFATVQKLLGYAAAIALALSIGKVITAVFVRKASAGATVLGIVLASVYVLYFAANSVIALVGGQGAMGAVISLCITGACIYELYLLIQALRATSNVSQMQAYQAQYWQYMQQQQQAYNAAGYNQSAYNQNAYNAPPTGPAQSAAGQTGWQWPAPPPPDNAPRNPPPDGGANG